MLSFVVYSGCCLRKREFTASEVLLSLQHGYFFEVALVVHVLIERDFPVSFDVVVLAVEDRILS